VAAAALEKELTANRTAPTDSHPALNARIGKARKLAIPTLAEDNRSAVTLFSDLSWLELQLLTKLMPALKPSELRPMQWETAGLAVYVPIWRSEVAPLSEVLAAVTIYTLPNTLADLSQISRHLPDPKGTLLTREQRADRVVGVIGRALTLVLIGHGCKLHFQPGQWFLQSENGSHLNPMTIVAELRNGKWKTDAWREYCETNGIGDWPLVQEAAQAAN
jgi:hypothetical protein